MAHPGYMLNPGDMFAVDVDTVLWATGRSKTHPDAIKAAAAREITSSSESKPREDAEGAEDALEEGIIEEGEILIEENSSDTEAISARRARLRKAKKLIADTQEKLELKAARKVELRALRRRIPSLLGNIKSESSEEEVEAFENELAAALVKIEELQKQREVAPVSSDNALINARSRYIKTSATADDHISKLANLYSEVLPEKSYEQPWVPRDWMAPFAYVPRYLEVNYTICSAVYLRHPVARPGQGEIPTPFSLETGGLAHNWYLRRR
jgi:ribosomal protein S4